MGCLIVLGTTGAFFLIPAMVFIGQDNVSFAFHSIDWTSFSTVPRSLWRWVRQDASFEFACFWVFGFCYCVLVWLWMAEWYGWRRFLSGKHLWAVSSIYFLVVEAIIVRLVIRLRDIHLLEIVAILIPIVFLAFTLPLWGMRTRDEP